ncbi:MAG: hypothetical protein JWN98_625 [Abditibacteriota bacterium]|nr:hypothetical protein [Abditibacteriota bacterium]
MTNVMILRPNEPVEVEVAAAIVRLTRTVWPPAADAAPPDIQRTIEGWQAQSTAHFRIEQSEVLAYARLFPRVITSTQGPLTVGALAAVCVHPDYRGQGWGAEVVRAAFAFLPEMGATIALFQTGVPHFYEKLGARRITNCFYNGTRADLRNKSPWWDPYVMIYPATFAFPEGDIDLGGGGF